MPRKREQINDRRISQCVVDTNPANFPRFWLNEDYDGEYVNVKEEAIILPEDDEINQPIRNVRFLVNKRK